MNQIEKVARPKLIDELALAIDQFLSHQIERDTLACDLTQDELTELATGLAAIAVMPVQAEPQWQGIESAPPPPNTRVLLTWRDWRDGKWLIEVAPYETGERVGPYSNVSRHGSATHWMPLPTPPAGGSDAE